MYKRNTEYIKGTNVSPDKFIEDFDSNNSELLYKLDKSTSRSEYLITKNEHRVDLIAIDIYGNEKYSWILMYLNKLSVEEFIRGVTIEYIPISELTTIINSI